MNISKSFTVNGLSQMTQCHVGNGVDFVTGTVRLTLHKEIDKKMLHLSLTPAEALELSAILHNLANGIVRSNSALNATAAGSPITVGYLL